LLFPGDPMPLFGEVFVSELIKMPVLDPMGEELGTVKDFIVIKGDPLPMLSTLIMEKKKKRFLLEWKNVGIFNKRIISLISMHQILIHTSLLKMIS
jgi:sporulation protein YlmC with PRC-barrel domain